VGVEAGVALSVAPGVAGLPEPLGVPVSPGEGESDGEPVAVGVGVSVPVPAVDVGLALGTPAVPHAVRTTRHARDTGNVLDIFAQPVLSMRRA
jgi:hypothetical protein